LPVLYGVQPGLAIPAPLGVGFESETFDQFGGRHQSLSSPQIP
jgi:hypothetical protein